MLVDVLLITACIVGGISMNMSNVLVITWQKRKKKKPKGYRQETIEAFYTRCYWVIVTYCLLLSCHCILSFNKIWPNIRGIFLLYQESSFGKYPMALWMLFIMLWYCSVTISTSSLSPLHLPRQNLFARIHKFLGVSRFLICRSLIVTGTSQCWGI